MYITTINGLHKELKQTDFYKQRIRKTDRNLIIDKCNFICNSIAAVNRHIWNDEEKTKAAPLHSDILQQQVGRKYKEFLDVLLNLGYIQTDNKYTFYKNSSNKKIKDGEARKYSFTAKALEKGIIKTGILEPRTEQRITRHKQQILKSYTKNHLHKKILYSVTDLKFNPRGTAQDYINKYASKESKKVGEHWEAYYDTIYDLSNYENNSFKDSLNYYSTSNFYYNAYNKVNRVYHTYTSIPKQYRKHLTTKDNKQLCEVDKKSCQPIIIALLFEKAIKNNRASARHNNKGLRKIIKRIKINNNINNNIIIDINRSICHALALKHSKTLILQEVKKFKDTLINGDIYNEFLHKKNEMNIDIPAYTRNDIKPYVLKAFYNYCNNKLTKEEEVLKAMYPIFFEWLHDLKHKLNTKALQELRMSNYGHKWFTHLIQAAESTIFINNFYSSLPAGYFAVPIHDSILCKVEDAAETKERLIAAYMKLFDNITRAELTTLFKTKNYE